MSGSLPVSSVSTADTTTGASSNQAAWDAAVEAAMTPVIFGIGLGSVLMQQQLLSDNMPND